MHILWIYKIFIYIYINIVIFDFSLAVKPKNSSTFEVVLSNMFSTVVPLTTESSFATANLNRI